MYRDLCRQEEVSTRVSPVGDWSKGSIVDWYFRIVQDSGEINYTSYSFSTSHKSITYGKFNGVSCKHYSICNKLTLVCLVG